ncbi:unnamed protein product [Caenorhabditis sp. 36 PRJEB53466]|nr:unnamed protein product [Caenorhabditis sp. 36 PRJEB53466]
MKVPHVIAEIVSEFSGFQHTPDFKASRSTGEFEDEVPPLGNSSVQEHHGHSLYFGKHLRKPAELSSDSDTHSNHSGGSKKHGGFSVHFGNLFHFGHHNEHHSASKPASGASTPARKLSSGSLSGAAHPKHSIHLTVGADEVPTICATPPNEPNHSHFVKNAASPNISRVASYSSLKEKLYKIKRTTSSDSETDFPDKKVSVSSYRVVGM